jgi:hypothetical protein
MRAQFADKAFRSGHVGVRNALGAVTQVLMRSDIPAAVSEDAGVSNPLKRRSPVSAFSTVDRTPEFTHLAGMKSYYRRRRTSLRVGEW